jgi:hypothetical protein
VIRRFLRNAAITAIAIPVAAVVVLYIVSPFARSSIP